MKQKIIIIGLILSLFVCFLNGCALLNQYDIQICGDGVCGDGEDETCPNDCTGNDCSSLSGDICETTEMCAAMWLSSSDDECCSETCETDISSITLISGKNYVSIPFVEMDDTIEDIVGTLLDGYNVSIYSYEDSTWKVWHSDGTPGDLTNLEAGRGYVVVIDTGVTLTLTDLESNLGTIIDSEGGARSPHSTNVYEGWNLIGVAYGDEDEKEKPLSDVFSNIDGTYTSLWMYNEDGNLEEVDSSEDYNVVPTRAYWLYVTSDGVIVP